MKTTKKCGCAPVKSKRILDYILEWVEESKITIKKLVEDVAMLVNWKNSVSDEYIQNLLDAAAAEYDWSSVPEFDAKADKVEGATENNFAALDAEGNLKDSGKKAADFADVNHMHGAITSGDNSEFQSVVETDGEINFLLSRNHVGREAVVTWENISNLNRALEDPDTTPTEDSDKLITSGAVWEALDNTKGILVHFDPQYTSSSISVGSLVTNLPVTMSTFSDRFSSRKPYIIKLALENTTGNTDVIRDAVLWYETTGSAITVEISTAGLLITITGTIFSGQITWETPIFVNTCNTDSSPIANSKHLITSGGVYAALYNKASINGDGENFSVNKVVFSEGDARAFIGKTDKCITVDDSDYYEVSSFDFGIDGDRISKTIPIAVEDLEALSSHDTEITENSAKLITSGAVYSAINPDIAYYITIDYDGTSLSTNEMTDSQGNPCTYADMPIGRYYVEVSLQSSADGGYYSYYGYATKQQVQTGYSVLISFGSASILYLRVPPTVTRYEIHRVGE